MGRGQLEVFIMRDPGTRDTHYLLRAADNNVMLDISDYIESFNVAVVGASMRSTLTLHRLDVVDSRP